MGFIVVPSLMLRRERSLTASTQLKPCGNPSREWKQALFLPRCLSHSSEASIRAAAVAACWRERETICS
ncbi:hypothetical protein CEXT_32421 [Caerostris extrusa]|uniref:Uncharacterized protein n=1 Tax=Caerostris extrusa TaxID=172846 RepID=A0AAV4RQS0_CAEEX|nr:hypothetical protein CEXT_32421 [Caerostris extrusa]